MRGEYYYLVKAESLVNVSVETASNEVSGGRAEAEVVIPGEARGQGLLICLEGDVATQHVIEQDAQAPNSQTFTWNKNTNTKLIPSHNDKIHFIIQILAKCIMRIAIMSVILIHLCIVHT